MTAVMAVVAVTVLVPMSVVVVVGCGDCNGGECRDGCDSRYGEAVMTMQALTVVVIAVMAATAVTAVTAVMAV